MRLKKSPLSRQLFSLKSKKSPVFLGFFKGFSLLLLYEIIEELIEEAVAWTITTLVAKALSFLLVVVLTQFTKVTGKMIAKSLVLVLKPVVKRFTYKEGNDKLNAIKKLIRRIFQMDTNDVTTVAESTGTSSSKVKTFFTELFAYLKRNVKTVTATVISFVTSLGSGALLGGGLYIGEIDIPHWACIVIGIVLTVIMFILTEFGIIGKGIETQDEYDARIAVKNAKKQEAAEKARVKKELEAEIKQSEEESKQARAQLLAEQEAAKKAQEEAIIKRKAEEIKAAYLTAVSNGAFSGSLEDWLKQQ